MRNRMVAFAVALMLVVGFVVAGCAAPAPTPAPTPTPTPAPAPVKPIELRLAFEWAESGLIWQKGWKPWIDEVEKRTGGKVKIVPYFSSTLVPVPEQFRSVQSGAADISEASHVHLPGVFPAMEVWSQTLPSTPWSKWSLIHWEMFNKHRQMYESEMPGVKVLSCTSFGPAGLMTVKKPIHSLEDVKGMKILAIGKPSVDQLGALGFTVVEKYPPEFYTTLEKGVVDASGLCPYAMWYEWGMAPLLKYYINANNAQTNDFQVMNLDVWNSLPPDVQKVFDDLGGEWMANLFDQFFYEAVHTTGPAMVKEKYNAEFITLPPEELARWDVLVQPVLDAALADLESKGIPAKELHDEYFQLIEKYKE
jgi:TRAP-type C4-dicarboxylate transport system substrate-binding protein